MIQTCFRKWKCFRSNLNGLENFCKQNCHHVRQQLSIFDSQLFRLCHFVITFVFFQHKYTQYTQYTLLNKLLHIKNVIYAYEKSAVLCNIIQSRFLHCLPWEILAVLVRFSKTGKTNCSSCSIFVYSVRKVYFYRKHIYGL